jgi:hypothetical protein
MCTMHENNTLFLSQTENQRIPGRAFHRALFQYVDNRILPPLLLDKVGEIKEDLGEERYSID